jgi:hypothetical protein
MGKIILPITIGLLQLEPSVPVADYKPIIYIYIYIYIYIVCVII